MFLTAFKRLLTPPAAVARPAPRELLAGLDKVETFPTLSDTVVRAMALVNDPDTSVTELVALVRRDSVLAAAVLKAANSWVFRGRRPVQDIQQAAVRLGLRECMTVITAVGMRGVFKHRDPKMRRPCEVLLRHGLFTAAIAAALNRQLALGFKGEEFTAGLLHDIGRVIVCVRAPEAFEDADPMTFDECRGTPAREREVLGTDHCELGAKFALANRLSADVASAIVNHHFPAAAKEHRQLAALVAVADRLANYTQRAHKLAGYDIDGCPGFAVLAARWDRPKELKFRAALPGVVVGAMRSTRAMLKFDAG